MDLTEFEELDQGEELRRANRRLQLELQKARAKTAELMEAVRQGARDAALVLGNPPGVPPARRSSKRSKPECALLLLSDWHFGKRTSSFDTEVAWSRVRQLGDRVLRIAQVERADHAVSECHVLLGGDLVDNLAIFPGHAHEVDSSLLQQFFEASGALAQLLRRLLAEFRSVHVWSQTGNHGRLGRRGDHPREDNADALVYALVRERLSAEEARARLVWHEPESWFSIVEVGAYRALLIHGDQVRSFGGNVPAYGISRKVNAWASGVLPAFTDAYMGHFHQPLVLPLANGRGRAFVNPSIESDSEYAREFVAATGTPGQRLHFIDPEKGRVTSERVLWLD